LPGALFSYAGLQCYEWTVNEDGTSAVPGPLADDAEALREIWVLMLVLSIVVPLVILPSYTCISFCIFGTMEAIKG
jgi:hypothetical protein